MTRELRTVNELEEALQEDRAGFIKGLIKAGYVDTVIYNATNDDNRLIELAVGIYTDLWDAFNVKEFESWVYKFA